MENALELGKYLPNSFKLQTEKDYVRHLWSAFESNYASGKYEFASLAFHLLYMSYVSFSLWQIRLARENDFKKALIGFQVESELKLLEADSPFRFYDKLKESQIFRFLKLIGCENEQVGEFSKFVKRRNKIAHPSGTVFFNDQASIDNEIDLMMLEVSNIQRHMKPVILEVYSKFLVDSSDVEEREYADSKQEIEANLCHLNYLSSKDIELCLSFDVSVFSSRTDYEAIVDLHEALRGIAMDAGAAV